MSREPIEAQCCIVGGGPAGIMAGLLLARAGIDVIVLEKHADFLRDFRGDTVHPSTMDVLGELGLLEGFLRRPHQELARIRAHLSGREVTIADFGHSPTREKFIAFMPQWDFLDFLVEHARAYPGFRLKMETEVVDLVDEGGRINGVVARDAEGEVEVRAELVIAADGRSSIVRAKSGLRVVDVGAPIDVLWLRIPRRDGDPAQSLGWARGNHFMVLIDRADYWQIAVVIAKGGNDAIRAAGLEAFRAGIAETAPFLADRVGTIASFDEVKLLSVTIDRLEQWWRPGLLCIGDAAHAMSPIGGVGINLAIQDAVAAANALAGPLRGGAPSSRDLAKVQKRRTLPTRATQALQVAIQDHVLRPALAGERPLRAGPALRLLDKLPWLQRVPAYLVGVGVRREHVASPESPEVAGSGISRSAAE